ncbi:HTTM domain-containing protein [Nesterenkonia haasae]|uniref:HTTM domain-containing protein n=1 Tax=Nesterenkonia haasae TaxID=2587813 RepID=UPI00139122F1|nr:HTTM domain-containing protein [Nesterenkonia haasae]NDK32935.1 HTTM domain-containing protein [Nesterenkonia haasae]
MTTEKTSNKVLKAEDPAAPPPAADAESSATAVVAGSLRRALHRARAQVNAWEALLTGSYKATYGIAVTRILMGLTGLGLLLTNFRSRHYTFGVGSAWSGEIVEPMSDFPNIWLFSLFHQAAPTPWLFTLLYIGLALLAIVVIVGWRTRIILPFYFVGWVSFIELNDSVGDQGDNAYRMFLLAMLFTNSSLRWSLDARRRNRLVREPSPLTARWQWAAITAHNLALVVLAFQVCAIYVAGGMYKAGGDPWAHGWAIYDPLQTAQFGTWPVLSDLLTAWGPLVVVMTWGSLMFQIAFPFLLFNRYTKFIALVGILSFHLGIGLLMGLPWFSLTMIAVDAIFIRDRSYLRLAGWFIVVRRAIREDPAPEEADTRPTGTRAEREKVTASSGPPV